MSRDQRTFDGMLPWPSENECGRRGDCYIDDNIDRNGYSLCTVPVTQKQKQAETETQLRQKRWLKQE